MDLSEKNGFQEMSNQKVVGSQNHMNGFKNEDGVEKANSYVIDLDIFSNGLKKEATMNSKHSRFALLRSLSRKVPQRGAERNINDKDNLSPSSSSKGNQVMSMSEKTVSSGQTTSDLPQHQIVIKSSGLKPLAEGKWGKRSSFKRSPHSFFSDPKRIVLFFAVVSSIGTMLLIYLTVTTNRRSV